MIAPKVLTIAGSDCSGGAGIQADLKTFCAHGCYGMSIISALTAQNTRGVRAVSIVDTGMLRDQIDAVFGDIRCDAVKTGMLGTEAVIQEVAAGMERYRVRRLVVDPVMVAKGGQRLLEPQAILALKTKLLPLARLITPNIPEAGELLGRAPESTAEMEEAARALGELVPNGAVLLKGGHLVDESDQAVDVLWDGRSLHRYSATRLSVRHTHGTGCTLSAAITCQLAIGEELHAAIGKARDYLRGAMLAAYPVGSGIGPVNHLWQVATSGFDSEIGLGL